MKRRSRRLAPIVLILLGLAGAAGGPFALNAYEQMRNSGTAVTAIVAGTNRAKEPGGTSMSYYFRLEGDGPVFCQGGLASSSAADPVKDCSDRKGVRVTPQTFRRYSKGDPITVYYDPEQPWKNRPAQIYVEPWKLVAAGIFIALVGVLMLRSLNTED